jgi:Mg/Co/Ni transporter MgtE
VVQGHRQPAWQADKAAASLNSLNPEARTLVLSGMPEDQRWKVLAAMSDDERAEVVIAASTTFRDAIRSHLGPEVWQRTMAVVKGHSSHAAR